MISRLTVLLIVGLCGQALCMYDASSQVVEITASNFQTRVIDSDSVWIVEFYAPWCGHCKSLVPEYTKAAKALMGVAKVGAVDMTQHQSVGQPYNVQGFPTIKIFGLNKKSPIDFNGARTAQGLTDAAMGELKKMVSDRMAGKSGGGSSGGSKKPPPKQGSAADVIELTDSNFEEMITGSDEMWLVEFFAPWCGHCKNLEPHWRSAAAELKGKVKMATVDATVHTVVSGKFNIRGFPTIKWFPAGKKTLKDAADYDGGRTASDIISWAQGKVQENVAPPELLELTSAEVLKTGCGNPLCVVSVLPQLLDCQSKCRKKYLSILRELGDKFKKNMWGWVWTEAGANTDIEEALGIGGFGYPAMAIVNTRKGKFSILKGPFTYDGIHEFLQAISYGRGSTEALRGAELPKANDIEKWDGKDGLPPQEEDIDLSDVELDDLDKTEL
jgi:protein disulfide-isomerase A6